jgi:alkaline phosphatase
MKHTALVSICLGLSIIVACTSTRQLAVPTAPVLPQNIEAKKAKNIIFLIGDGMGLGQITAGMYANGNKTALAKFPVIGLHKNIAYDALITDSAAGATAFSTGVRTFNGAIGVGPDSLARETILELAEKQNKATGLVATSTIVHATPGSFIAHDVSRKNNEPIARDFLDVEVDLFIGGGKKYFDRRDLDTLNITDSLIARGYLIRDFLTEISQLPTKGDTNIGYFTADTDPLPYSQGRDYLQEASAYSIDYLHQKNDNGFFLMIEGSQIDWGGHANVSDYIISEFIEFDAVVDLAIEWAKADGETLVVVTADHETGGYAIQNGSTMDSLVTAFTSTYHTGTMVPVFAYGPGSETFGGIYENIDIFTKMVEAGGLRAGKE